MFKCGTVEDQVTQPPVKPSGDNLGNKEEKPAETTDEPIDDEEDDDEDLEDEHNTGDTGE